MVAVKNESDEEEEEEREVNEDAGNEDQQQTSISNLHRRHHNNTGTNLNGELNSSSSMSSTTSSSFNNLFTDSTFALGLKSFQNGSQGLENLAGMFGEDAQLLSNLMIQAAAAAVSAVNPSLDQLTSLETLSKSLKGQNLLTKNQNQFVLEQLRGAASNNGNNNNHNNNDRTCWADFKAKQCSNLNIARESRNKLWRPY